MRSNERGLPRAPVHAGRSLVGTCKDDPRSALSNKILQRSPTGYVLYDASTGELLWVGFHSKLDLSQPWGCMRAIKSMQRPAVVHCTW